MGVGEDFKTFCGNLAVTNRDSISSRYELITRRFNLEFWNTDSRTNHSIYAGSFGRNTATGKTSDVDMIFWLPVSYYNTYNAYSGNGQSALLQLVRSALQKTYSTTHVGADGQIVAVSFQDGITFETLPAFVNTDGSFTFPDSNGGGSWKTTNPRPEISEINRIDKDCNGNLKNLCKMARAWKKKWDIPISGLLIDTLAYNFIRGYEYRDKSYLYYDFMSRDFFEYLRTQPTDKQYWLSPGANQYVWRKGAFEYKALRCKNIAVEACSYQSDKYGWTARQKWREIYGTEFPA
ncbi:SMODS domain-containing nucleotidyltransferase [Sulfuriflexus sp.]|uniref:SMODS domain-containing nucleotidyltransferase n=1 Tax=Sulfuriflexus sp. TaxID=2015443 RepID=UPI0028CBCA03|nr:nucleotidyltransferase [Sulfuriflexus sp.]MDT8405325.1 nucleotidyltransferase [Sulfuriflexus sp.]